MRSTLSVLLFVVLGALALGAQSAPAAETGPREFQFGSVKQGEPVSHSFVLRNRSDVPLRILSLDVTPGLRLARMPAQIPPGEQVDLKVSIDTAGLSGEYEGQMKVHVNDAARSVLVFDVSGVVTPPVEFRPHAALFVVGQRGKDVEAPAEGSIEIVNHQERPLRFTRIEYPEDRFSTRLDELEAGHRYRLTLTLNPNGPAGRHQDMILLHTDDGRRLRVAANTRLRERVYAFPEVVDLGEIPKAAIEANPAVLQAATQALMVYQLGGTKFRATFSTDIPGLRLTAESGPAGDRWQATVTLQPAVITAGPIRGSIIIETNDPEFPRITVPVTGAVTAP
jgi:Protein of unknown function (DUF1573)